MRIVKRILGVLLTLFAILMLLVGFRDGGVPTDAGNALDSPEASGRLLGTLIPVVLFGTVGLWLLFSKRSNL